MNITKLEFVLRISLVEMCFFSPVAQVRLCWKVKVSNIYLSSPAHHQAPVLGGINDTIYEYVGWEHVLTRIYYCQMNNSRVSSPIYGVSGRRDGHNDRFYEEFEYERRVRKRRAKLVTATEEAFAHIKRMSADQMKGSIFPQIFSFIPSTLTSK